jgi:hypothetical protein
MEILFLMGYRLVRALAVPGVSMQLALVASAFVFVSHRGTGLTEIG